MEKYDYCKALREDIRNYIKYEDITVKGADRDELYESLYENLWVADSVTGNGSGSYTYNRWEVEENICHNLELLAEAMEEFGDDSNIFEKGAEACDVTIRCYLLGECLNEVLDEIYADEEEED